MGGRNGGKQGWKGKDNGSIGKSCPRAPDTGQDCRVRGRRIGLRVRSGGDGARVRMGIRMRIRRRRKVRCRGGGGDMWGK